MDRSFINVVTEKILFCNKLKKAQPVQTTKNPLRPKTMSIKRRTKTIFFNFNKQYRLGLIAV